MAVKANKEHAAMMRQIKNLPKYALDVVTASTKKAATAVVKEWKDGLKKNSLRLDKLKPETVARKKAQDLPFPSYPLYGAGDTKENSLYNALRITAKNKKGVIQIVGRKAKHWKAKELTLAHLLAIHEFGVTIIPKGDNPVPIILPPRPGLKNSWEKVLRRISKETDRTQVKKAVTDLIRNGRSAWLDRVKQENEQYESDDKSAR